MTLVEDEKDRARWNDLTEKAHDAGLYISESIKDYFTRPVINNKFKHDESKYYKLETNQPKDVRTFQVNNDPNNDNETI